jgi:regulator of sigma E protease
MLILISASLGIMNLLPIPALDGGRLVFMIIEAIRGKAISPEKEGMVHFVGLILLFGLMILLTFSDIQSLVRGGA